MNTDDFFEAEIAAHGAVVRAAAEALREPFGRLLALARDTVAGGGKILLFGNGGSAADAQHIATELTVRYRDDRPAIAALALTTDTSALTAIGNDLGFAALFARQLEALGRPGDLAIAISTSGMSENVVQGAIKAREMGLAVAALTGESGGRLAGLAEPLLAVPSRETARIQEVHILLGHMLCAALEKELAAPPG